MPFAAALFDLDGTLLNTIADIADAVNAMLIELGTPPLTQDTIQAYVGKGSPNLVRRALAHSLNSVDVEPAQLQSALALFSHHYARLNGNKTALYPRVLEGLNAFMSQGTRLAIVTNKPTLFTRPLLERTGIAHFFEQIVCGDTCAEKKPHPMPMLHACTLLQVDPADALVIGDSANDALSARAANITVLAVPYGYNEGRDVRTLDVDDIVMSIEAAAQWAAQYQTTPLTP